VVIYEDAKKLIDDYRKQPENIVTKEKLNIIKKLERFSVALYPHEIDRLGGDGMLLDLDTEIGIKYLNEKRYSDKTGVVFESDPNDYIVS
jgi:CRISPR-associated endonuclease/helicase Cas3